MSTKGKFLFLLHFALTTVGHARGSLAELETQIVIAKNLDYLDDIEGNKLLQQIAEVGRLLNGLLSSIKKQ
jgi:four helix bundle protein